MLASTLELESSQWREGMIEGLTASYALASGNGLQGRRLYFAMLRRFMRLAPGAYRRYLRTYTRLGGAATAAVSCSASGSGAQPLPI